MNSFLGILLVTSAMQPLQDITVKTQDLELNLTPRTPNQMSSFYESRAFPKVMIDTLRAQCFISVRIHNNSNKKIWLDLDNWKFSANGKPISRETRDYWKAHWQSLDMPLSKQSTFRWTLLPESLDYLPGEHEGGNIILPLIKDAITLTAIFATGEDKQGEPITFTTDKLYCAEDAE